MWFKRLLLAGPMLLAGVGCTNYTTAGRYARGLVMVLPGIEGRGVFNQQIVDGLGQAGIPYALEVYDWTSGLPIGFLAHLIDYTRNRQQARNIAGRLVDYRQKFPGRPIWLLGQSGGGGVLVMALEELPDDFTVTGAVLLAPALSPEYNLARALRHSRGPVYHFYSPNDSFFLGMGTQMFGTIDRKYRSAAGRRGFQRSLRLSSADVQLYDQRLRQIDCSTPGNTPGHPGLHLTSSSPTFIAKVVAPLIWRPVPAGRRALAGPAPPPGRYHTVPAPSSPTRPASSNTRSAPASWQPIPSAGGQPPVR